MRRLIVASGKHEIAWTARDGVEAVHFCRRDRPEIVLMDLIMPNKDGVEATREIMAESPCPILIVTEAVDTNPGKVFDAMGAGALDVVRAPSISANGRGSSFLFKIDSVGRLLRDSTPAVAPPKPSGPAECLVAIGSSAGGPAALAVLLRELPADFPAAIVIVQHVDAHFAPGSGENGWENPSKLPVRAAERGDVLAKRLRPARPCRTIISSSIHPFASTTRPIRSSIPIASLVGQRFFLKARPAAGAMRSSAFCLTGMRSDAAAGLKALSKSRPLHTGPGSRNFRGLWHAQGRRRPGRGDGDPSTRGNRSGAVQ